MTYCFPNQTTSQTVRRPRPHIGVYECEVKLKFRIIEEDLTSLDREHLLQLLVDAFAYGSDEYLEPLVTDVDVQEVTPTEASPEMRRQLIRIRNASSLQ